ncbi:MAG: hypothetical protein CL400_05825 [Acidiferrobacteraceae bacterium]|nr:hypothetical protein [Acidiferrobacteraceae bacterium]
MIQKPHSKKPPDSKKTHSLVRSNVAGIRDVTPSRSKTQPTTADGRKRSSELEGINLKIIELLQEDGRATFSSIAEKLGVSESTVRTRVTRMREKNMIHFITVTNPLALGQSSWAMLGISIGQSATGTQAAEYFRELDEVVYVMRIAGRYDLLVEVVVESPAALRIFLDQHCYESNFVTNVEPMVGLGLYKSLYKWEIPVSQNDSDF